eukprot:g7217.t1
MKFVGVLLLVCRCALAELNCTVSSPSDACRADWVDGATRLLNGDVFQTGSISKVSCAASCAAMGYPVAGVENGGECHCGTGGVNPKAAHTILPSSKCATPCSGAAAETCGGVDAIELFNFSCTGSVTPNYKGCESALAKAQPYCDESLSIDARLDAMFANLTLLDKIGMISPQRQFGSDTCGDHTAGADAIGLGDYFWLVETNTNVAAKCFPGRPYACPTTFIGPMGMGASFNRTSWRQKGGVLGTEMRAFHNIAWHRGNAENKIGLTGFGPNINIARDPRFGRASELPGEDPYLNGHFAAEMVAGMQEEDANGHPKMLAYLKHFTAYSKEANRGHDTYNISTFDLWDSYLPQYEIAFKQGNASGVMCSYDAENGRPSCANGYILNDVIRGRWNQTHAFVTTDCGAVSNMRGAPANAPSDAHAAAWTINNGTDLEMGSEIWTHSMADAVQQGLVAEATVERAARRGMRQLLRAGRFDAAAGVGWSSLGAANINSTHAQAVSREAALMGMVLLKNDGHMLPLRAGAKLAVVGPMGVTTDLMSDYAGGTGEAGCWPDSDESCVRTIAGAIADANAAAGGSTAVAKGVDVNSADTSGVAGALALARAAEAVVLVVGNDRSQEHEGIDRPDTALPGQQQHFAEQVLALGKPTVLLLSNGGALAVDTLVGPAAAVVEAFNPAQQTPALAALLFGAENRWGKLPVTMYPHSFASQKAMGDFDMSSGVGRTYKYYSGAKPLFEFGTGLSYTTFSVVCSAGAGATVACDVANTGDRAGDEVVMAFHAPGAAIRAAANHPVPLKALVGFERVRLAPGEEARVEFAAQADVFRLVDAAGERVLLPGARDLVFSNGAGQSSAVGFTCDARSCTAAE